jgi:hypothetical protein
MGQGTDKNFLSYADVDGVTVENKWIAPPDGSYADTLKLSHASNIRVNGCTIVGGYEDCVDLNRECKSIIFSECRFQPQGGQAFTIKGGTDDVLIGDCVFETRGKSTDIELGAWSDQSSKKTTRITIQNCVATDGGPVRVRVWYADKPLVISGNVKVTIIPGFIVTIYRWLRKRNLAP